MIFGKHGLAFAGIARASPRAMGLNGSYGPVASPPSPGRKGPVASLPSPARKGGKRTLAFGSIVLNTLVRGSLSGEVDVDFDPEGLRWTLNCPGDELRS